MSPKATPRPEDESAPRAKAPLRGRTTAARGEAADSRWLELRAVNFAFLGLALIAIVAGYVLLDRGSVTAAPILLMLGYVVLIPAAILFGFGRLR